MTALQETAWYVYAVMPDGQVATAYDEAILPGAAVGLIGGVPDAGEAALAALASLVPRALFALGDPVNRGADPEWVAARAAAHHAVVSQAHAAGTCLPLGFGTLFATTDGVRAWLAAEAPRFRRALAHVAGRHEWAVTLVEDGDAHAAWLRSNDKTLQALAEAAARAGTGTGFLIERRVDKALKQARAAHGAALAAMVGERLEETCPALAETPAMGAAAAWSVLASSQESVRHYVAACETFLAGRGFALRVTGPWPPYAFARAAWQGDAHV